MDKPHIERNTPASEGGETDSDVGPGKGKWIAAHDAALAGLGSLLVSSAASVPRWLWSQQSLDTLEGGEAWVGDLAAIELGDPRMTNASFLNNLAPLTAFGPQEGADFNVEWFHAAILVRDYLSVKEPFTNRFPHARRMTETKQPINRIVADNLAFWMAEAKFTQSALAERAGVSQKTISNYLNPDQRAEGSTGKPPSAKLSELEQIASALGIEVWQLTRGLTASERRMYEAIEQAYKDLKASAATPEQERADKFLEVMEQELKPYLPRTKFRKTSGK